MSPLIHTKKKQLRLRLVVGGVVRATLVLRIYALSAAVAARLFARIAALLRPFATGYPLNGCFEASGFFLQEFQFKKLDLVTQANSVFPKFPVVFEAADCAHTAGEIVLDFSVTNPAGASDYSVALFEALNCEPIEVRFDSELLACHMKVALDHPAANS